MKKVGQRLGVALSVFLAIAAWADPPPPLPSDSIYQLKAGLTTQDNHAAGLDLERGHPTLISMFYGSCPAACPMLITAMQVYEKKLPDSQRAALHVLLISFDAERDTPAKLQKIAQLHRVDSQRWMFASAAEPQARKIAALLGFQYRRQPDGNYDHSLLITLLDENGRMLAQTTNLIGDEGFVDAMRKATSNTNAVPAPSH